MKKKVWYGVLICLFLMKGIEAKAQTVLVLSSEDEHQVAVAEGFSSKFSGNFEVINLEASEEKLRNTGESLSSNPPALLLVSGNPAAQMAKWYLEEIPVIYCSANRAPAIELSGSNVFGVFHEPSLQDQFSALIQAFPQRKKIGLIYNIKFYQDQVKAIAGEASRMGIELVPVGLANIKQVPVKTREIVAQVQVLWAVDDPDLITPHTFPYIILQSIQHGVPVFSGNKAMAKGGATAALSEDAQETGALLAQLANSFLQGQSPSPRIQYPQGRLILNTKTAAVMSIQFPTDILDEADEVIQ